jgi:Na+-exporting ATPase
MAVEFPRHPFLLAVQEVTETCGTDIEKGLLSIQVAQLQRKYPLNELDVGGAISWYTIFIRQLFNAMILVCNKKKRIYVGRESERERGTGEGG